MRRVHVDLGFDFSVSPVIVGSKEIRGNEQDPYQQRPSAPEGERFLVRRGDARLARELLVLTATEVGVAEVA
jgi:hypothetical protein